MNYDSVLNDKILRAHHLEKIVALPVVLALSEKQRLVCRNSIIAELEQLKHDIAKMANV